MSLFFCFCSASRCILSIWRRIFSSSYFWCLSLALSSFSAFSFAISVNFLARYSSKTSLLILFSRRLAFAALSFCKSLASNMSIPSRMARLPLLSGFTTERDLDVPPNAIEWIQINQSFKCTYFQSCLFEQNYIGPTKGFDVFANCYLWQEELGMNFEIYPCRFGRLRKCTELELLWFD